jgi:hypothetical protein
LTQGKTNIAHSFPLIATARLLQGLISITAALTVILAFGVAEQPLGRVGNVHEPLLYLNGPAAIGEVKVAERSQRGCVQDQSPGSLHKIPVELPAKTVIERGSQDNLHKLGSTQKSECLALNHN